MQSSSNTYLFKLDHLRAFAAYMVFCWHFLHLDGVMYYENTPGPFGLLTQGHTGVALFMCISGYIFTYLTYGMKVNVIKFWINRALRLVPLMVFWFFLGTAFTEERSPLSYFSYNFFHDHLWAIVDHNGYWSIFIELRYYLLFPVLLFAIRKFGPRILIPIVFLPLIYRAISCGDGCSMHAMSYWTVAGRADQFLWGTAAFYLEKHIRAHYSHPKRLLTIIGGVAFAIIALVYWWFNLSGGYSTYEWYHGHGGLTDYAATLPHRTVWLYMPTIEAICYSAMIIGYMQLNIPKLISKVLSLMGKYSYSLYLGHPHFIQMIFTFIVVHFGMPQTFFARLAVTTFVALPVMLAISAITYKFIETPFLRLRCKYLEPLQPPLQNP